MTNAEMNEEARQINDDVQRDNGMAAGSSEPACSALPCTQDEFPDKGAFTEAGTMPLLKYANRAQRDLWFWKQGREYERRQTPNNPLCVNKEGGTP